MLKRDPAGTSPMSILCACPRTHPRACILSLVAHQDVKYISLLQWKYGRYKDAMVAFVVVFGTFPSCSPISRDPGGDHHNTRGLNSVTERNCFLGSDTTGCRSQQLDCSGWTGLSKRLDVCHLDMDHEILLLSHVVLQQDTVC